MTPLRSTPARRRGDAYEIMEADRRRFTEDGFVHLPGVLDEDELAAVEATFQRFLRGDIPVPGKDFCDMSSEYSRRAEDFSVVNIMLPRKYHPAWRGNLYERRAAAIAGQLCGPGMVLDYDQLLAKRPGRQDAVFHWHQDLAYWPVTEDTRTATCWLAVDAASEENGCLRFVVGSHREPELRPHLPMGGDRGKSHTLVAVVDEARDRIQCVPASRGDVVVLSERVVHGSGGNRSRDNWRRAYVVAFRSAETVAAERRMGFTHSHNDAPAALNAVAAMRRGRSLDPPQERPAPPYLS
ncbi:MAG: phytanoyl-CoA dioxygenase family protein [Planctomycetota bacterium]|nr:MAG: phytanoyl-CoA dioxygenase family protein [Planctomycetota bacterium]